MDILVIGGGGREHAICAAFKKSKQTDKLYCAPGNAGIADIAECVPIGVMEFEKILAFARDKAVDLVFVAPDDPLYGGLVDLLEENGIRAFGPKKNAAVIEGSKAFSKEFMLKYGIPTAAYEVFDDFDTANKYLDTAELPIVLKADGLALGKGVIIAHDRVAAKSALKEMMLDKVFGGAGNKVVIEEFLTGKEFTLLVFCDGTNFAAMPACQDHKKAYDEDKGPNTGGMGAFCPTSVCTESIYSETVERIVKPTVLNLKKQGREFKGVLYFGLMATERGVKVIEYNARFGDPETQAVLPLLKTDFVDVALACMDGTLKQLNLEWEDKCGFCLVACSGGYPGKVVKGYPIKLGELSDEITLFHAGTAIKDGQLVTNGGRVLCVTTKADSIAECREIVYREMEKITFNGIRFRKDIGIK